MSDGASWYYSLPEEILTGHSVYFYRGEYHIGKYQTIKTRDDYATSGEGFYPTVRAAQNGIIKLYKNKVLRAKEELAYSKKKLAEVVKVLK